MSEPKSYPNLHYRWSGVLAAVAVVSALTAVSLGAMSEGRVGLIVALIVATLAGIGALAAMWIGGTMEADLARFRAGAAVGAWSVEGEQWAAFARSRRHQATRVVHRGLGALPVEVRVGVGLVLFNDRVVRWSGPQQRVTEVALDGDGRCIVVHGETSAEGASIPFEHVVPFPPEAAEAALGAALSLARHHGLALRGVRSSSRQPRPRDSR